MRRSTQSAVRGAQKAITEARDRLLETMDNEQIAYESLSERAQDGPPGERIEQIIDDLSIVCSDLDSAIDKLEEMLPSTR